jgi:hypothetical protein
MFKRLLATTMLVTALSITSIPAWASSTPTVLQTESNYDDFLPQYVVTDKAKFLGDALFIADWAKRDDCQLFNKLERNEFEFPALLDKAKSQIESLQPDLEKVFYLNIILSFGSYNAEKQAFEFRLSAPNETPVLKVRNQGRYSNRGMPGCSAHKSKLMPYQMNLILENAHSIDGIKIATEEAKKFLQENPSRQVLLQLGVKVTAWQREEGRLSPDDVSANLEGKIVAVSATLYNKNKQPFYTFSEAGLVQSVAALGEAKQKYIKEASTSPAPTTDENINAWIKKLTGNPLTTFPDGTPLRELVLNGAQAKAYPNDNSNQSFRLELVDSSGYPFKEETMLHEYGTSIRNLLLLTNSDKFVGALPVSSELADKLRSTDSRVEVTVLPEAYDAATGHIRSQIKQIAIIPITYNEVTKLNTEEAPVILKP